MCTLPIDYDFDSCDQITKLIAYYWYFGGVLKVVINQADLISYYWQQVYLAKYTCTIYAMSISTVNNWMFTQFFFIIFFKTLTNTC